MNDDEARKLKTFTIALSSVTVIIGILTIVGIFSLLYLYGKAY